MPRMRLMWRQCDGWLSQASATGGWSASKDVRASKASAHQSAGQRPAGARAPDTPLQAQAARRTSPARAAYSRRARAAWQRFAPTSVPAARGRQVRQRLGGAMGADVLRTARGGPHGPASDVLRADEARATAAAPGGALGFEGHELEAGHVCPDVGGSFGQHLVGFRPRGARDSRRAAAHAGDHAARRR